MCVVCVHITLHDKLYHYNISTSNCNKFQLARLTVGEDEQESLPLGGLGEIDLLEHHSLASQQLLGSLAE